jgi:CysZ protein
MRDLAEGLGYLAKGQRWVARHGRWWGFGLLPGLVTMLLYVLALAALALWGADLVAWATPFADDWGSPWQSLFRIVFTVLLFCAGLLLAVITFTAVALVIGEPFYEALAERVEESEGGARPHPGQPLWREVWTSIRESLYVLVCAGGLGLLLFVLGFLPVAGQTVIPAVGFCVTGFFLAAELTAVAFQRRAVPVRARLALLRGRLMLVLGFGVPLVLLFLVPLAAVFLMPGAVAGATLLVRDLCPAEGAEAGIPGQEQPEHREPQEGDGTDGPGTLYPHLPQVPSAPHTPDSGGSR